MIESLPRREREIFEILLGAGEATAAEIRARMADPPSYSAVRTLLSRLEARGYVRHRTEDQAYVYAPAPRTATVRDNALKSMVKTFFDGSAVSAASALLGLTKKLTAEEAEALRALIDQAKEQK
jgi:predicted transcriptional regulator